MVRLNPTLAIVLVAACTTSLRVPPSITPNVERDTLEQVVASPNPPDDAVVFLVGEYLTEKRLHEGRDYFAARAKAAPDSAVFEALDAFFAIQLAPEIGLLSRAAYVEGQLS